ncbi:hypothetical protein [Vibrio variabilis]|uniref:hypothetical protein n=1 Tax=Vibrio variabilis TaxID=990271 RepID=UPI000DD75610|nr:hypothetical protein [Vibrio variabilis]
MQKLSVLGGNQTIQAVIAFSAFVAIALFIRHWPNVAAWQLGDNDNFMRLHQLQVYIQSPSLLLQPLERFNPQDGQIIHWSRLPDLPILAIYYLFSLVLDAELSLQLAIAIVPILYLMLMITLVALITQSVFGRSSVIASCFFTVTSLAALKCYPGQIDHHNIQLLLFALFSFAVLSPHITKVTYVLLVSGSVSLSLLIGLEVLPFFILMLAGVTLSEVKYAPYKITWIRDASLCIALFGSLGIIALFPESQLKAPLYDVISLPLLSYFVAAWFVLTVTSYRPSLLVLVISSLIVIPTVYYITPEPLSSPYKDYPSLLNSLWLEHVIEAKPLIDVLHPSAWQHSESNFLTAYLVTMLAPFLCVGLLKTRSQKLLWVMFVISLIPALLWQMRTIVFSAVLALPLQSCLATAILERVKLPIIRLIPLLLLSPIVMAYGAHLVTQDKGAEEPRLSAQALEGVAFIRQQPIEPGKMFTPMEVGAQLLSLTEHAIIAAPYHRNIRGNLLYMQVLLTEDLSWAHEMVVKEGIDYLYFDPNDRQIPYFNRVKTPESLLHLLLNEAPPPWLTLIAKTASGQQLYRVTRTSSI